MDVPDWAAFVREPDLVLDSNGRLYVLPKSDDPRVRVLDEDGAFVRYVGRRGNGPGEFASIASMGFAGDTLWLQDFPTGRMSFSVKTGSTSGPSLPCPRIQSARGRMGLATDGQGRSLAGGRCTRLRKLPPTTGPGDSSCR